MALTDEQKEELIEGLKSAHGAFTSRQLQQLIQDMDERIEAGGVGEGGAVDSVNAQTGVVVLTQDNVGDGAVYKQYSVTEKTKLSGVATGATANSSDVDLKNRVNHTGTQSADTITDGVTSKVYTADEKTKLTSVASNATANASDASLRDRSTHTGTQPTNTIDGLPATLAAKADLVDGKVPAAQLPAYVDDIIEYANVAAFPGTGASGILYVAIDTDIVYRWSGSTYIDIGAVDLVLGETASTAYRGDRGKTAYDHSQLTGNPHGATLDNFGDGATNKAFTGTEKTKLSGIATGATANSADVALVARANHTGTQSADTITDGTTNKAFLATERTKLAGISSGATANSSDAALRDRSTHSGTQTADTITDGTTNKTYTATEKTKLSGIATGATANNSDANLLDRANHTGTQSTDTLTEGTAKLLTAAERTKLSGIASGATANSSDAALIARANHTGTQSANTITGLAAVATSGAYADLSGKPTIPTVSDVAYDATTWNANTDAPSKNAVRDKFESLASAGTDASALTTGTLPNARLVDVPISKLLASDLESFNPALYATLTDAKTELIAVNLSDNTTAITAGTGKAYFRMPWAGTLTAVKASALTAPTGAAIIIDINEAGTTVLSTKLSIAASSKTSVGGTAAVISDAALAADAEITFDFDQVGSTVAGAGVIVYLTIIKA